jgi:hypothetical protein
MIKNDKVMAPQSKEDQEFKKKTIVHYKGPFLNTQKVPCMCCSIGIKVPR